MLAKNQKNCRTRVTPTRTSEVLDVKMAAELLTVSPDSENNILVRAIERIVPTNRCSF
jgi:hypothetical protein